MTHTPREKCDSHESQARQMPATTRHRSSANFSPGHNDHDAQNDEYRSSFFNTPQNDPWMIDQGQHQPWPPEQPLNEIKVEQSGFNPHPKLRQGPRRPPPLIIPDITSLWKSAYGPKFKPFVDPPAADRETPGGELPNSNNDSGRTILAPKDANQTLRKGSDRQNASCALKQGEDWRRGIRKVKQRQQRNTLVIDELETSGRPRKLMERMPSLVEEPTPLRIRKTRDDRDILRFHPCSTTPEQSNSSRIEAANRIEVELGPRTDVFHLKSGHCGDEFAPRCVGKGVTVTVCEANERSNDEMESLLTAITRQLSELPARSRFSFEHPSAIPKPLHLAEIKAAKAKREMLKSEGNIGSRSEDTDLGLIKTHSAEFFATDASLNYNSLGEGSVAEHNGARRKWYKGFHRSE